MLQSWMDQLDQFNAEMKVYVQTYISLGVNLMIANLRAAYYIISSESYMHPMFWNNEIQLKERSIFFEDQKF